MPAIVLFVNVVARLNGIYDTSALCAKNIDALRERMDALHSKQERSNWENIVITMLEVLIEMRLRGIFVDMEAMASVWKERKKP